MPHTVWKLELPQYVTRSRLYHLQPVGRLSGKVESLTSYISRLSESHGVTFGTLLTSEIAPLLNRKYLSNSTVNGGSRFYDRSASLVGSGDLANDTVTVLEQLTGTSQLQVTTLINWGDAFSSRGLLRPSKAWCPVCYQEWASLGQVVYDPLIWFFQQVEVCSRHLVPLMTVCEYCGHIPNHVSRNFKPGYCPRCNEWLGKSVVPTQISQFETWVNQNIEQLLELSSVSTQEISKEKTLNFIRHVVDTEFKGNIAHFGNFMAVPKVTAWYWYRAKSAPSIANVLKICYQLNMPLVSIFVSRNKSPCVLNYKSVERPITKPCNRRWRHFPRALFEMILIGVLDDERSICFSMQQIANILGINKRTLYHYYPQICHNIASRHKSYLQNRRMQQLALLKLEVTEVFEHLTSTGTRPTRRNIEAQASVNGILRYQEIREHVRQISSSFGYF